MSPLDNTEYASSNKIKSVLPEIKSHQRFQVYDDISRNISGIKAKSVAPNTTRMVIKNKFPMLTVNSRRDEID